MAAAGPAVVLGQRVADVRLARHDVAQVREREARAHDRIGKVAELAISLVGAGGRPLEGAGEGLKLVVSSPLKVHDVPKVPARRAPNLGEHNQELLKQLGFTGHEIDEFRAIGTIPHTGHLEAASTGRQ